MLVVGMSSATSRAQSVKRRDSEGGREVAVAAPSGRAFCQLKTQLPTDALRLREERRDGGSSLHRGAGSNSRSRSPERQA